MVAMCGRWLSGTLTRTILVTHVYCDIRSAPEYIERVRQTTMPRAVHTVTRQTVNT